MVAYGKAMRPSLVDVMEELNAGGGGSYTLPTASADTLGGVKVGSGLAIDSDGVLSASGGSGGSDDSLFLAINVELNETQGIDAVTYSFTKNWSDVITTYSDLLSYIENYPTPIFLTVGFDVNGRFETIRGYGTIRYDEMEEWIDVSANFADNIENINFGCYIGIVTENDELTVSYSHLSINEINSSAITNIYNKTTNQED